MSVTVPLYISVSVVLNGSGAGTANIGPLTAREVWHPATAHVQANQNPTNEAVCNIFVGDQATQPNWRDATFSGSSGDTTDAVAADTVKCGWKIWAVWTNGDAGARATLNITGTKDVLDVATWNDLGCSLLARRSHHYKFCRRLPVFPG